MPRKVLPFSVQMVSAPRLGIVLKSAVTCIVLH